MKPTLRELHTNNNRHGSIDIVKLFEKYYRDYSIQEMMDYQSTLEWSMNIEAVQKFIDRKKIDLMKVWTEE